MKFPSKVASVYTNASGALVDLYGQTDSVRTLTHSLLLGNATSQYPGLRVETLVVPAGQDELYGGDFSDAFRVKSTTVAVVVGDISGKGLEAARCVPQIKYALRAFLDDDPDPARAVTRLNRYLCSTEALWLNSTKDDDTANSAPRQDAESSTKSPVSKHFCALSLALIDSYSGTVKFVSAGAEPAIIIRQNGRLDSVSIFNLPVGIDPTCQYRSEYFTIGSNDIVLMLTDGLTEARRDNTFLGYEGFKELVRMHAVRTDLADLAQTLINSTRGYAGGQFQDDACILLARRSVE